MCWGCGALTRRIADVDGGGRERLAQQAREPVGEFAGGEEQVGGVMDILERPPAA